jgi:hypothetical protein
VAFEGHNTIRVDEWLDNYRKLCELADVHPVRAFIHHCNPDVYKAIEKDAECPKNLTKSNVDDWELLSAIIKRRYPQQDESQAILLKLTQRRQLAGEPAGTFLEALQALATRIDMDEKHLKIWFYKGLLPGIRTRMPTR